mgnify:CR=1 FL=1
MVRVRAGHVQPRSFGHSSGLSRRIAADVGERHWYQVREGEATRERLTTHEERSRREGSRGTLANGQ